MMRVISRLINQQGYEKWNNRAPKGIKDKATTVVWKQVPRNLLSTISNVFYCQKMHSHQIWRNLVQWAKRKKQI